MASVKTKFSVGLFVILGISAVFVFIVWLGMYEFFREGRRYVVFFDESVQGLNKDSAVKYRGVGIGRVESISVAPDGILIRIVLNLDEPLKQTEQVVAQIKSVGITGLMFVELERKKSGEVICRPRLSFEPKYPVIATKPSEIKKLLTDIHDIVDRLKSIDVKRISELLVETLDKTNQTLTEAEVKNVSAAVQQTLAQTREVLDPQEWTRIRKNLLTASAGINQLIENAENTVSDIDKALVEQNRRLSQTLQEFQNAAEQASFVINDTHDRIKRIDPELYSTLKNLEGAGENINKLVQDLMDQPSMLFFSNPPPAKPIERKGH
jgi:phospholipid/cholesterol/gamma-HCH transport system substrate-binding protein